MQSVSEEAFFFFEPPAPRLVRVGGALNNEFAMRAKLWTFRNAPVAPTGAERARRVMQAIQLDLQCRPSKEDVWV